MKTHTGGCHCKAVRYKATTDLAKVISCNCSHCAMKGLVLTFIPANDFTLLSGEAELTDYRFNKKVIHHLFCKHCGVQSFSRGSGPDGKEMVALNVRCLDGIDVEALTITPVDGKNW